MKSTQRTVITAILSIGIGIGAGWLIFSSVGEEQQAGRKILYYRDPMNPENTSPTPKKAPDGMDFVPVYAEEAGTTSERKIAYYEDPMHPWFTSDKPGKAPDCGMDMVPVYEDAGETKGIRINPVTVQNIGVRTEEVRARKLKKVIRTVGKVEADETKIFSVNTKVMGWVEHLGVDYTGKPVHQGEPLLELYSPELVSTQEEYLQAIRYEKQMTGSTLDEARTGSQNLVESARRRLSYWDIPESEITELERRGTPKKTMTIYSPVNGFVMDKMVYQGQNVMAGMELYRIADLSTVWIIADVYQYELPWVKVGQAANVHLSYVPGKTFRGTVTYVYPMLNMETKTAKVRIEVRNTAQLEFRPEMFATVEIISPVALNAVAVPEQAIIRSGERNVAVIALGGGFFDPRPVKLGVTADGYVQILDGIHEGEKIVVSSQFLIDSESNLKAAISQMSDHAEQHTATPSAPDDRPDPAAGEGRRGIKMDEGHGGHDMQQKKDSSETEDEHRNHDGMTGQESTRGEVGQLYEAAMDETGHSHTEQEDPAQNEAPSLIDPVCGMKTSGDDALSTVYNGKKYYFCSTHDMEKFTSRPEQYTK